MNEIWCNGQWLPADKYPGAAQDRGAFLGLGLFETMAAIDGIPVFADRHLARLRKSCEKLGWSVDLADFKNIADELLVRNSLATGRARLRLIVTAGSGPHNDLTPGADRLVWLAAFSAVASAESISVCLSPWPRNERSPLAGLKTACYAENLVALDHARRLGFDETLFLNTVGHLCESATANLFLVKNGVLLTPSLDSGCLPGIGREVLCELAPKLGIPLEERPLFPADLHAADEIFLSSSTRGPVPVTRCEGRQLPLGPVTAALRQGWELEIAG
ncbi:MAG: aminotransferase class IV [Verrucomicrobiota bacterium]